MIFAAAIAVALLSMPQASSGAPTPAPAPAPGPAASTAPSAAPAAPAEQICRRQPIEGSRRVERVCYTREEWARVRANAGNNRDRLSQDQRNRD